MSDYIIHLKMLEMQSESKQLNLKEENVCLIGKVMTNYGLKDSRHGCVNGTPNRIKLVLEDTNSGVRFSVILFGFWADNIAKTEIKVWSLKHFFFLVTFSQPMVSLTLGSICPCFHVVLEVTHETKLLKSAFSLSESLSMDKAGY